MNIKLHAVADAYSCPLSFCMPLGSEYTGATALLNDMPRAQWLLDDRGCDADWIGDAFQARGIRPAPRPAASRSDTTSPLSALQAPRSCSLPQALAARCTMIAAIRRRPRPLLAVFNESRSQGSITPITALQKQREDC
jgi:hypothetical protein